MRYRLESDGQFYDEDDRIAADQIEVPHLVPHVVTFDVGAKW